MGGDETRRSTGQVKSTVAEGGMLGRTAQRNDGWMDGQLQSEPWIPSQCFENTVKGEMLGLHFVEGFRKFPGMGNSDPTTLWGSHLPVSPEDKLK